MNQLRPSYLACSPLARLFGWAGLAVATINTVNEPTTLAAAGLFGWALAVASRMAYDIRTDQLRQLVDWCESNGYDVITTEKEDE